MSFLGKIMDTMRLNDDEDDDYFLDDDYEDEKPARKNLFKKQTADDLDDYEEEKPRFLPRTTNSNKVVPMRRGSGMEVSLIKPTSLDDAKEICDYLLAGKAVVLNILAVLMAVLVAAIAGMGWSEGAGALAAIAGVGVYYFVLWLFRAKIEHTIQFTITKI